MNKYMDKVFKYRYIMAAIIFAACVFVGLNGSSIGCLVEQFGQADKDVLFGVSRQIRSDEFGTFTPMTWAQYRDPAGSFSYFSSVIRGAKTDAFITYGQPVRSILMIFRPFQIGYLFLPIAQGMAFFWCGRFIVLLMVSFEFARLITDDDRRLSVIYSLMTTLAPAVQWWFAVNGFVEMLIAAQLSIVLLNKYLNVNKSRDNRSDKSDISFKRVILYKIIYAIGIMLCAGTFILTLYPAWMVPMAYVILALILWQLWDDRKRYGTASNDSDVKRERITDVCLVVVLAGILSFSLYLVYNKSAEAISLIMNTSYPGRRFETGGGAGRHLFNYISEIWYAHRNASPYYNVCESAYFIDLFPLGHILYLFYVLKNKKTDVLANVLFVISIVLFTYAAIGVPDVVAKLSLLGYSTANRALVIFSFVSLLMLIRSVSIIKSSFEALEKTHNEVSAFVYITMLVISAVISMVAVIITRSINPGYFSLKILAVSFVLFTIIIYGFLQYAFVHIGSGDNFGTQICKGIKVFWQLVLIFMIFFSGLLVNPIRLGVQSVDAIPELQKAAEISEQDRDALWIVEGSNYPITNALLLKGIRTINSTNVYPDIERWKNIDTSNDSKSKEKGVTDNYKIYNRYAHIETKYINDSSVSQKFKLIDQDCFRVYLTYDDLKKLDVRYVFSSSVIDDERLELLEDMGDYHIYRCK